MADDMQHDELDVLTTTSADMFYASTSIVDPPARTQSAPRRSLRPRQSLPSTEANTKSKPRKRTLSTSALQNSDQKNAAKKIKLDQKKAVSAQAYHPKFTSPILMDIPLSSQQTGAQNKKREARDDARKKWLYCHRDVVEPLLPPASTFFDQLQKEMEREHGRVISFVPTHVLDEQPKLIKGGQMKDYQVGIFFFPRGRRWIEEDDNSAVARRTFVLSRNV